MSDEIKRAFDELFALSHANHKKLQEKLGNKNDNIQRPFVPLLCSIAIGYKIEVHRAAAILTRDLLKIIGSFFVLFQVHFSNWPLLWQKSLV